MNTYRLKVSGRVQGVHYRKYVVEVASMLNYEGYVKNLHDGSVEVVLNAEYEEELEFFISKLYEGSLFSDVKDVHCQMIESQDFDSFEKRV